MRHAKATSTNGYPMPIAAPARRAINSGARQLRMGMPSWRLVDLGPRAADHLRPARRIAADGLGELLGRAAGRLIADLREALLEDGRADRLIHRCVELRKN